MFETSREEYKLQENVEFLLSLAKKHEELLKILTADSESTVLVTKFIQHMEQEHDNSIELFVPECNNEIDGNEWPIKTI